MSPTSFVLLLSRETYRWQVHIWTRSHLSGLSLAATFLNQSLDSIPRVSWHRAVHNSHIPRTQSNFHVPWQFHTFGVLPLSHHFSLKEPLSFIRYIMSRSDPSRPQAGELEVGYTEAVERHANRHAVAPKPVSQRKLDFENARPRWMREIAAEAMGVFFFAWVRSDWRWNGRWQLFEVIQESHHVRHFSSILGTQD